MRKKDFIEKKGFVKFAIVKNRGIALHRIKLNQEMKTITVNGQIIAKTDDNGVLKYSKYEYVDEHVQDLMTKWLKKTRRHDCEQL